MRYRWRCVGSKGADRGEALLDNRAREKLPSAFGVLICSGNGRKNGADAFF